MHVRVKFHAKSDVGMIAMKAVTKTPWPPWELGAVTFEINKSKLFALHNTPEGVVLYSSSYFVSKQNLIQIPP